MADEFRYQIYYKKAGELDPAFRGIAELMPLYEAECWPPLWPHSAFNPREVAEQWVEGNIIVALAYRGNETVGMCMFSIGHDLFRQIPEAASCPLFLKKEYRGKGIGRALQLTALDYMRDHNLAKLAFISRILSLDPYITNTTCVEL